MENNETAYHHYRPELIEADDRVARLELHMLNLLLNTNVGDEERESSIAFELKHHHSTAQFARALARKRNLDIEICTAGALLHDVFVIVTGKYKNHARAGEPYAREILVQLGGWSAQDIEQIVKIIVNHSDKHIFTNDPYIEFGKDVDILDCFLYPRALPWYKANKPKEYFLRARAVFAEMGIPFKELDE
jgi:hypothetical protein